MARYLFRCLALVQYASLILAQNDCVLTVPPNPLSAQGLATPYQQAGCNQRQFADQASFVEAAIFDPATNTYSLYHPLVINQNDKNFIKPVVPTVPQNAVVAIWFGTNGNTLTLKGNGVQQGLCVNGLNQNGAVSIFGQFAYCNAPAFFAVANAAVANGSLVLPPPGTANDGTPCPVTRDFRIVDMDPDDNTLTTYLLLANGTLAQNTPANNAAAAGAQVLANGSDEGLVAGILDPLFGCTPFKVPSLTAPTGMSAGLPNNELVAAKFPPAVQSLVPMNDPMCVVTNNGATTQSAFKTSLYRLGVGQPPVSNAASGNGTQYCKNFPQGCLYIALNQNLFAGQGSPMPGVANNLFTFMAQRWSNSFAAAPALDCVNLLGTNGKPIPNPIALTMNGNGVVTAVSINTAECSSILAGKPIPPASSTSSSATKASSTAAKATSMTNRGQRQGAGPAGGAAPASAASASTASAAAAPAGTSSAAAAPAASPSAAAAPAASPSAAAAPAAAAPAVAAPAGAAPAGTTSAAAAPAGTTAGPAPAGSSSATKSASTTAAGTKRRRRMRRAAW